MLRCRFSNAVKSSNPSLTSCVDGWPLCCTSGLSGWDWASASCSVCGRYRSSMDKTTVGRLWGSEERVEASVVTYL